MMKSALWNAPFAIGLALAFAMLTPASASVAPPPTTEEARANLAEIGSIEKLTLAQLVNGIDDGVLNSEAITEAYLKRIAEIDDAGPTLNAVIATFPDALDQARALDAELRGGKYRGLLHGIPILLKDNIEAKGPLATTAGSLALKDNVTNRDAPFVARLREAGMVILGKTNLSEWANIRSNQSTSGWSAIGGLTKNPHALDRNACGSSSGSAVAVAASLTAGAIGTETDGSVTCPAGVNGIVGFKPTVGLVSRRYIVPISHSQDTAGPMARSVRDVALILSAMAGSDPEDPATDKADNYKTYYAGNLGDDALNGVRVGVIRAPNVSKDVFEVALAKLSEAGATLVPLDVSFIDRRKIGMGEFKVLLTELKADMAAYLQGLPADTKIPHKTLADIIAFNKATPAELEHFDQSIFETANNASGLDDPGYLEARKTSLKLAGAYGLDRLFNENSVEIIVAQTNGPAWLSTLGKGDKFTGPSASGLPAVAGYPHLTVPMGMARGLPVGLSFIGRKWDDHRVLRYGHAFEQVSKARRAPSYAPSKPAE
ncbi:MAG: amidase [Sphingorhabdus sp.]